MAHLVSGLVQRGRILTTYPRAKEASRLADRMVTLAKRRDLHARRQILGELRSPRVAKTLIDEISPLFEGVAGGYTRVIRYKERHGDGAPMAFLEFTRILEKPVEEKKKKEKKKKEKPARPLEEKKREEEKKRKPEKKPKKEEALEKGEVSKKEEGPQKEEQKKGGFLTNLRKFLTGE